MAGDLPASRALQAAVSCMWKWWEIPLVMWLKYIATFNEFNSYLDQPVSHMLAPFNSSLPGQNGWRHFQMHFHEWRVVYFDSIFVPKSPAGNKSTLVQVMASCWTGDKPSTEAILTQFTDAYMEHYGGDECIRDHVTFPTGSPTDWDCLAV